MILVGLDADRIATVAAVDPAPLSAQGEMLAQLLGLRTYTLRWMIGYLEINARNQWSIRYSPAPADGPNRVHGYDVIAEHRCSVQALPGVPSVHNRTRSTDTSGDPPF